MSEQVNTEKAINEKANSEPMIRILKKVLQTPSATYAEKSKKAAEADIQDNLTERLDAVRILQQMGKDANSMVPELIEIVKQDDTELAAEAALALGSAGLTEEQANVAMPVLVEALTRQSKEKSSAQEKDEYEQYINSLIKNNAAFALSKIGKPAVKALIPLLSHENVGVCVRAVFALSELCLNLHGDIPAEINEAVSKLGEFLKDDQKQAPVALALAAMGKEASAVLPILIPMLQDHRKEIVIITAMAIRNLGETAIAAIPALITTLGNKNLEVRRQAARALAATGNNAIPALQTALQDKELHVRQWAIFSLGEIGRFPVELADNLNKIVYDEENNWDERRMAASVLELSRYNASQFFIDNNIMSPKKIAFIQGYGEDKYKFDTYQGYYRREPSFFSYSRVCCWLTPCCC